MTCKEFKAPKCRFCHSVIPEEDEEAVQILVCSNLECVTKSNNVCPKRHSNCNHPCQGFKNEKNCLPCLNKYCARKNEKKLRGQDIDSFCTICYVEDFRSAACV